MATQSTSPTTTSTEENSQNSAVLTEPKNADQSNAQAEATKQNPSTSVFVNKEPIREEQVQNAVKFLSHPKVRGSPVIYRRSFLEKKGLTKEEIDEAFRLVPDPPPSAQAAAVNQDGQVKTSSSIQPQTSIQNPQPAAAAPTNAITPVASLTWPRFHWSHAILAVGLLAVSGAGTAIVIRNSIVPRLKSWIRKVVLEDEDGIAKKTDTKPSLAEEAAAAAKSAAAAAADVAKASQEMLNSKNEERRYFVELMNMLDVQVQEMKSMSNAIRKLEGEASAPARTYIDHDDRQITVSNPQKLYVNGKADYDSRSVRSASPPASAEPSIAPHSKSYMEIMAMVQRGEKPSNIREINDLPPNPNQQPSNPRLAPRSKPWEVSQTQNNSNQFLQSQGNYEGLNTKVQDNGSVYQSNGDSSVPGWQRRNARITEIENEDGSYGSRANERPVQRTWVPPQPPPVLMPEAAEAIRRPKPSVQKESAADGQFVAQPSDITDELQKATKLSESGGAIEINGGSSNEIQEAGDYSLSNPEQPV
ncbi:peroxisomal membrane protein PEX14 isoform X1 [Ziziphus jujuba]|uniref:Peroxisomal membrane protein PEX14 n=1 Tax=Ziziphus jujuba TaxID=326968 RepID=A0A6P3ZS09_ZIZJJ|nr:peroxisomal membrane protein PEX14 isoform X1 [Ziziphus jujuba]XP_015882590.3 peroxisomal membrane protein PEX14 isoform X1 [Ziziphus jujuba]